MFHPGLNAIRGTNRGKNSIGKSTVLYIVDWALGGSRFAETEVVKDGAVGHHTIFFTFEFDGQPYYFARATDAPEYVDEYEEEDHRTLITRHKKDEYTQWLKEQYGLSDQVLTFRQLEGPFLRIQASASAKTQQPLSREAREPDIQGVRVLEDLFGLYEGLQDAEKSLSVASKNVAAVTRTQKESLIRAAAIRTAKRAKEVEAERDDIDSQLAMLRNSTDNTLSVEDQGRSTETAHLKAHLQELRIERGRYETQASVAKLSLQGTPPIKQDDLEALQQYFPLVNVALLQDVETFHAELTEALLAEFQRQFDENVGVVAEIDQSIHHVQDRIRSLGKPVDVPEKTWDEYGRLAARKEALEMQLETWNAKKDLAEKKRILSEDLDRLRSAAYSQIQATLNHKLAKLNGQVTPDQKPPDLSFRNKGKNYTYGTPGDEGTGVANKDLSLLDLALLDLTPLGIVIHDSDIFHGVDKDVVGRLLSLYRAQTKQIFISFDREEDYEGTAVEEIISEASVIELGPGPHALYGRQWNKTTDKQDPEQQ